jgi:hypothetical protein
MQQERLLPCFQEPPIVPALKQMNPILTLPSYCSMIHINVILTSESRSHVVSFLYYNKHSLAETTATPFPFKLINNAHRELSCFDTSVQKC